MIRSRRSSRKRVPPQRSGNIRYDLNWSSGDDDGDDGAAAGAGVAGSVGGGKSDAGLVFQGRRQRRCLGDSSNDDISASTGETGACAPEPEAKEKDDANDEDEDEYTDLEVEGKGQGEGEGAGAGEGEGAPSPPHPGGAPRPCVPLFCACKVPFDGEGFVACASGSTCGGWVHWRCQGRISMTTLCAYYVPCAYWLELDKPPAYHLPVYIQRRCLLSLR